MNKRESLLKYLDGGEAGGPAPAAFFMHFGDAYRAGKAAIDRHAEFFRFTGMDFVKIQFELSFPKVEVWSPDGFAGIPSLPLAHYEPMLEVVKGVVEQLGSEALVVLTLYSPFMIAGQMAGNAAVIDGLESDPEPVYAALERITESLSGFVHACKALGLDGFYHSTQGGESRRFKGQETFLKWVKPIDMRLMKAIEAEFKFNILHICDYHAEYGGYDDLTPFLDYPGTVVNVSRIIGGRALPTAELSRFFGRPYMGGLNRLGALSTGSEADARAAARSMLKDAPPGFILGADCTVPGETPWENLRGAVEEAHGSGEW